MLLHLAWRLGSNTCSNLCDEMDLTIYILWLVGGEYRESRYTSILLFDLE